MRTITIPLDSGRVALALGAGAALLVVAYLLGLLARYGFGHDHVFGLLSLFNLDAEHNIPAFFSSSILLMAGTLLAIIAQRAFYVHDGLRWHWAALATGFFYLAMDEAIALHERINDPVSRLMGEATPSSNHEWAFVAGPAAILAGLAFIPLLRRLKPAVRGAFILGGLIYVAGAAGVEIVGTSYALVHGESNPVYGLLVALEEGMEMGGVIVFIWALLEHLASSTPLEAAVHLEPVLVDRQPDNSSAVR